VVRYIYVVFFVLGLPLALAGEPIEAQELPMPNIILILTDDQSLETMQHLSRLKALMADKGVTFSNAFVTTPLCCPSRVSILRGQYTHNHGVITNKSPAGGHDRFLELGLGESTLATWLQGAGYKTVFIGKYLNGYSTSVETFVPPGWSEWYAYIGNYHSGTYKINHNGDIKRYDTALTHDTNLFRFLAEREISEAPVDGRPFFMAIWTNAPHGPALYPPQYADEFLETPLPRSPSFNEEDVSDKPRWIRNNPLLTEDQITAMEALYRRKLRSMLSVEHMIWRVLKALKESRELSNTYIIFTSDNGFHMGEHRLDRGKQTAYEEDIRVPLIVRGPGVPQGETREQIALNIDLAPTIAELAGAQTPEFIDGSSLAGVMDEPPAEWREDFLIEAWPSETVTEPTSSLYKGPTYAALWNAKYTYVEYADGETELYNRLDDPYQLNSIHASENSEVLSSLDARLEALKTCSGDSCRLDESPAPSTLDH
jgi:N-acetylglucosamine-6-sulfatase